MSDQLGRRAAAPIAGDERLPLRERKKQRSRAAIVRIGTELFARQGFEKTTVAEIAETAEIAPSTFFTYFQSKQDILFVQHELVASDMIERIEGRRPGQSTLDVLEEILREQQEVSFSELAAVRARVFLENPRLDGEARYRFSMRVRPTLTESLAADIGERPDGVSRSAILAGMTVGVLLTYRDRWLEHTAAMEADGRGEQLVMLDAALAMLRAALAAARNY